MNTSTTPTPVLSGVLFGDAEHLASWGVLTVNVQDASHANRMSYCVPVADATGPVTPVRYSPIPNGVHVCRVTYPMRAALEDLETGEVLTYSGAPTLYANYAEHVRGELVASLASTVCGDCNRAPVIAYLLLRLGYSWTITLEAYAAANMTGTAFSAWRRSASDDTWAAYDLLEQTAHKLAQKDRPTVDTLTDLLCGDVDDDRYAIRAAHSWAESVRLERRGGAA